MTETKPDIALFLDLDNVAIGASEVNIEFDIFAVLEFVKRLTNGRIVLRRAYADWRLNSKFPKSLARAGFELESTVTLGSNNKNVADMQMVVDAMETLLNQPHLSVYILITGDRDFIPLVHCLRKRGKHVIGIGIKHTTSQPFIDLCDEYILYQEILTESENQQIRATANLIAEVCAQLFNGQKRVSASLFKEKMNDLTDGGFARSSHGKLPFTQLLKQHRNLVTVIHEDSSVYVEASNGISVETEDRTDDTPLGGTTTPGKTAGSPVKQAPAKATKPAYLPTEDAYKVLVQGLADTLAQESRVRTSLLKQHLQKISDGLFNEARLGFANFHRYLEKYPDLVAITREGSTSFAQYPAKTETIPASVKTVAAASTTVAEPVDTEVAPGGTPAVVPPNEAQSLSETEIFALVTQVKESLFKENPRVPASLFKQHMIEQSHGVFSKKQHPDKNFQAFLSGYPTLVQTSYSGTVLWVHPAEQAAIEQPLHLQYQALLKKQGVRIIEPELRLKLTRAMINCLQELTNPSWKSLSEAMVAACDVPVSRSMANDVLRVARRAEFIAVPDNAPLTSAIVSFVSPSDKPYQDCIMKCDATYLRTIESLGLPFDMEAAALALYNDAAYTRYLKVVASRFPHPGLTSPLVA